MIVPECLHDGSPIRTEHDLLGDRAVPADAYYGVHTLRALENFPITGTPISIYPDLVIGAGLRQAGRGACQPRARPARRATRATPSPRPARRSARASCTSEFVVDVIQGGAGTSTNMNANEVIANRALELLGHAQGRLRAPAPDRPRQPERRAPTTSIRRRSSSRCSSASGGCCDGDGGAARGLRGEGRGVRRRAQDRAARSCRTRCR